MKLLDRYIIRQFLVALGSAVVFMIGLYLLLHFFSHMKDLSKATFSAEGYSTFTGLCTYYAVHLPFMVVLFGPYAILFAGMFTLHQLEQQNELTPIYAVGIGRLRVCMPVLLAAVVLAVGLVAVRELAVPSLSRDMERMHRLLKGREEWKDEDVPLLTDSRGNVFHVQGEWDGKRRVLRDVYIQRSGDSTSIRAGDLAWSGNGAQGRWTPSRSIDAATFDFRRDTDLTPHDVEARRSKFRLSFEQLREMVRKRPDRRDLQVLMHTHITYAFTPLVLLLMGLPLVMRGRNRNVFIGLGICLVLSLAYFAVSQFLQRMGTDGDVINPMLGAWLPVILGGALGLVLYEGSNV